MWVCFYTQQTRPGPSFTRCAMVVIIFTASLIAIVSLKARREIFRSIGFVSGV